MTQKLSKLLFIATAAQSFFIIQDTDAPDIKAFTPEETVLIAYNVSADIYGKFIGHVSEKFSNPTAKDIADLWATWSINNITADGKLKDNFSITEVNPEDDSLWGAFGINKERAKAIANILTIAEKEHKANGGSIADVLSNASRHAKSHAELIMMGFSAGDRYADANTSGENGEDDDKDVNIVVKVSGTNSEAKLKAKSLIEVALQTISDSIASDGNGSISSLTKTTIRSSN